MPSLLDHIFENLDVNSLNRMEVLQHLDYLEEINPQIPSANERVKFEEIKVLLDKRLVELNRNS